MNKPQQQLDGRGGAPEARRPSSSTMKPEEFAQGEQRARRATKPAAVANLADGVESAQVEKHMVTLSHSQTAPSLAKRRAFSSSFLQPEQFIAELKVTAGADIRPELSLLSSRRHSAPPDVPEPHETELVEKREIFEQCGDLESFYEPANSVPTLELCYEGKPAPAPAHLRTRVTAFIPTSKPALPENPSETVQPVVVPEAAQAAQPNLPETAQPAKPVGDKNSEEAREFCESRGPPSGLLQKSSSQGPSGSCGLQKLVRSLSGGRESSSCDAGVQEIKQPSNDAEGIGGTKQSGRLRRMLHWGASMEFLKSLGKKGSATTKSHGERDDGNLELPVEEATQSEQEISTLDPDNCSPRSDASSVSTTYSEVSSKSQSYKHTHKKNLKSEAVKSKLWLLRVHQKLQGRGPSTESEDEGDGIYEALRQGAMFQDNTTTDTATSREETDSLGVLNGAEKNAISKLVAKHKRNSTWDADKLTDHIFSPKQPRLPTRDAHVLLAPPKRLTGDNTKLIETETFQQRRNGSKPSRLIVTEYTENGPSSLPLPSPSSSPSSSQLGNELPETANSTPTNQGNDLQTPLPPLQPSQDQTLPKPTPAWNDRSPSMKSLANSAVQNSPAQDALATSPVQNSIVLTPSAGSPVRVDSSPTPPVSPGNVSQNSFPGFSPPLPLPVRPGSQSISAPTNLEFSATSPRVPNSPRRYKAPVSPGMRSSSTALYGATSPGKLGFAGMDSSTPRHQALPSVEQFSLDESSASSTSSSSAQPTNSVQRTRTRSVAVQQDFRSQPRTDSAIALSRNGLKAQEATISEREVIPVAGNALPLPREPRPVQGFLSFEQIVAGRGQSPPTDNTLMKFFFKCREIDSLNKFLALQKRRFLDSSFADSEKCFHMIMSGAGAGLSSMISTICTAWLLENTMASATTRVWHPIPVMNMFQKDMWNHRDAAWLFHVCGIDANAVLFRDEITPTCEAVISGRVKRAVIGQDILVTKADEVASSCTIVSEKFRQEAPKLLQARYMMTLLLAGILVDTNNLTTGSPRDKQQATILLVGAGSLGRNGFYNHLMNIRDEDYVTLFIKEIYGDSNALTGEKPAQLAQPILQPETKSTTLPNNKNSEKPAPVAISNITTDSVTAPISPPPAPPQSNPSSQQNRKSEPESKKDHDTNESLSKNQTPSRNSKISHALRRLRNRSSAP